MTSPLQLKERPRLDTIPRGLCTGRQAAALLGLTWPGASRKFDKLEYAEVIYKKHLTYLYRKRDVLALRHDNMPEGYVNAGEAADLLGITCKSAPLQAREILKKAGIKPRVINAHHSFFAYPREEVETLANKRKKERNLKQWLIGLK